MAILDHLEAHIVSARDLHDEGVHSITMALLDRSGSLTSRVITSSNENPETLYQACSISKAITSLAVAKLHDDGRISYDDKIVDHLPSEYLQRLGKIEPLMNSITVGSLVSHRSGLSQHGFSGYSTSPRPGPEDIFLGHPPANTPRIRFDSFPFAQFSYSGGAYLLLQVYLEIELGQPFHEIMQRLVFQPLGMARSSFADLDANEHNYAKPFATADVPGITAPPGYHSFTELAAAGLWTTPADLLKAVTAIQYSLDNDDGFLTKATAHAMLTKVTPNHPDFNMAMGWGSDDQYFGHSGYNHPGYTAYVFGSHGGMVNTVVGSVPDAPSNSTNVAFAIMADSALGFPVIRKIVSAVFHLDQWSPVQSLPGKFGSLCDTVPYPSCRTAPRDQSWKAWVGRWNDDWVLIDEEGVPKLRFRDQEGATCLFPAAEAGNSVDGVKVRSLVAEACNIAVRLMYEDNRRKLEIVQNNMRHVIDRHSLL